MKLKSFLLMFTVLAGVAIAAPATSFEDYKAIYQDKTERLGTSWQAEMENVLAEYQVSLEQLRQRYKEAGDIDGVISTDNELKRLAAERLLPFTSKTAPGVLAKLQKPYLERAAQLKLIRDRHHYGLMQKYIVPLDKLKRDLVRTGNIDEAKVVDAEIKQITATSVVLKTQLDAAREAEAANAKKPAPTTPPPLVRPGRKKAAKFEPMFNKKDLTGWTVIGDSIWYLDSSGNRLACKAKGGNLFTEKTYASFHLKLEYLVRDPGGDSGVFIHVTETDRPAESGMEVQLLKDDGEDEGLESTGAIKGLVAPNRNAGLPHPKYNTLEIISEGDRLKVELNGKRVINEKGKSAISDRLGKEGHIGFQGHSGFMFFRNIELKEL